MSIIEISDDLAQEIDKLAGPDQRSSYAAEILWQDIRRLKQRAALKATSGAWRSEDHPELCEGGAAYVERLRSEPDQRFEDAMSGREL